MSLEKAPAGPWQSTIFSAAYFDGSSGRVPYFFKCDPPILHRLHNCRRRTSQRFNPDKPACLIARLSALDDAFLRLEHGLSKTLSVSLLWTEEPRGHRVL